MTRLRVRYAAPYCRILTVGAACAFLPVAYAQQAPATAVTAPDAATLAKWDTNKNGRLDPEEIAAMQAAAKPAAASTDDTIMLTPYEVSTDKDRGYAAGNTLSGGRTNTPLAITPAAISVMTKEFLEDFDITDLNQAAAWTVGMDAATGGESDPFGGSRFQASFRGAGTGGNFPQRNGSLQYFVADSYNTERFEFSRGPNTSMFGDGGPGGLQGSSSKQARLNSRTYSASVRLDSFGSYRGTLDANIGLDKLGFRLNLLHQNTKSYVDNTSNKQNGFTIQGSYKISQKTTFRAEFERSGEWNRLYGKTYTEQASLWDRTTVNTNNTTILAATATAAGLQLVNTTANASYLVWNFGTNSLIDYIQTVPQYRSVGLGYNIPWEGRSDIPRFKPGVDKKFNLAPVDAYSDRDFNAQNFSLDHRFTPNFFVQLGVVKSDGDPNILYNQSRPSEYRIDVNRLLPSGAPNPKFGSAYAEISQNSQNQQDKVREYKLQSNYQFSIPKAYDLKGSLNFLGGWRNGAFELKNSAWRWANNPANADPNANVNVLRYRMYWDDPQARIASVVPPPTAGYKFVNVETSGNINSRTLKYAQLAAQTTFLNKQDGNAVLAFTGSYRMDDVTGEFTSRIGQDPVTYKNIGGASVNGVNVPGAVATVTPPRQKSQAWGVVSYPFPASWRLAAPIGFVFNSSSNFSQVAAGIPQPFINGEQPPLSYSKTKDVGLRYAMPNGVAYLTVSHYNTTQLNIETFGNATQFRNIWTNLGYTDPALTTTEFNFSDTNERKLEGWEVELTANPTRNITFTANYSHPLVYTVNQSPSRRSYYAEHRQEFANGAAGIATGGRTIGNATQIAADMQTIEDSFNGSTAGTLGNTERHRINVAGSYSFTEGTLRGLRVTGGINYRGYRKVGSRDPQIKFNTTTPTVIQNAQAAYDYLWVDPTWTYSIGSSYTRRIGKYQFRFQANITNPFNDSDPRWSSYSVITANQLLNGNPRMQVLSGFSQPEPRKIALTTTVSF